MQTNAQRQAEKVTMRAKVSNKTLYGSDILEMTLTMIEPKKIVFTAGQFINLQIPHTEKIVKRSYSIASSPGDANSLILCLKVLPDGIASKYLASLPIGSEVVFEEPAGFFTIKDATSPIQMIATGTGIAPFMSMIQALGNPEQHFAAHSGLVVKEFPANGTVSLLFGVRSERDIFWQPQLEGFARQFPWFSYDITLSQPTESWIGTRGRVTEHVESLVHGSADTRFFICGSPPMVLDMRKRLIENGIDNSRILFELFT